ncbi:hypothetical protein QR680_016191 [Steinernema hermaphroditum]|uniref:G-protein coupled receptors family 1 profile domain-containing protein n=1 Tax=Steinernema hermaphroditum TaxID=289476 RepID=A0AA39LM71_9BILA|nr:hypothetical protein QR680_016191 [Steinernema hermaphroditum]
MATNETFVFGSELLGRDSATGTDRIVGVVILLLSLAAIILGSFNIYLIKRLKIFHNAFGWFWTSRTVGEIGSNFVHVVYSGPMTILQPTIISPSMGIAAFIIGYFFACHACVMHQVVSVNRMVAVCFPIRYRFIFTKRICKLLIAICWIEIVFVILSYLVIPCQMVGYSPTLYEYVFVKCEPMERDFSYVGTAVNRFCFCVCFATVISDFITLMKIIQIKRSGVQTKIFKQDVRFFCQTSIQNITMMIALTMVVVVNNKRSSSGVLMQIFAFDTLILTHVNNALALILFNPEVRAHISGKPSPPTVEDSHKVTRKQTAEQPTIISPSMGIAAFTIGYFFACHACVMHQVVSVNRMVAVCFPLKYRSIFTKRICKLLIAICWIEIVFVILSYLVIPCQMVGYSPTLYEPMERDFSYVGTTVNRFCFCVCFATVIADLVTLVKIIQIQRSGKQNSRFLRDVRFFCQTSVQNVTMMIALTMVVVVNNSKSSSGVLMQIFAFDTLILTHVNNALALIIFNPEVRARISGRILPQSAAENSKRSGRTPSVSRHPVEGTIPVLQQ